MVSPKKNDSLLVGLGARNFIDAATAAGVKPIIGIEAYLTPGSRFDRPPRRDDRRYHMTILAESDVDIIAAEGLTDAAKKVVAAVPKA